MISLAEVEKLDELARLELVPAESEKLRRDLSAILDYVAELKTAPTSGVVSEDNLREIKNTTRSDEARPSPAIVDGYVKVKKILG